MADDMVDNNGTSITFFSDGDMYRQAIEPIALEASQRGYDIRYTDDLSQSAEIGIYSNSPPTIPSVNSQLSIITFHGIDSGYSANKWHNWSRFDIGLLVGEASVNNWKQQSSHPAARPNIGVFPVGWPKSDIINNPSWENEVDKYSADLGLADGLTVLYAPSYERNDNMIQFINASTTCADDLLIKHSPYDNCEYIDQPSHKDLYQKVQPGDSVHILPKSDNIFYALSIADIVISDSLSVLLEALLTETIPLEIHDWKSSQEQRYDIVKFPEFMKTAKHGDLHGLLRYISTNHKTLRHEVIDIQTEHYENIGNSSKIVVDLIDSFVHDVELPVAPVEPANRNCLGYFLSYIGLQIELLYLSGRGIIKSRLSEKSQQRLERYGAGKVLEISDRQFRKYNR